jgi:hypothetical protein
MFIHNVVVDTQESGRVWMAERTMRGRDKKKKKEDILFRKARVEP